MLLRAIAPVALIAAVLGGGAPALAHDLPECNVMYHDYLVFERTYILYPTGEDDTENLRCVLHEAWHDGSGVKVRLLDATYQLDTLTVAGYEGTLYGQGAEATHIVPLPSVGCVPDAEPALLRFAGGDVVVRDLRIDVSAGGACDDGSDRRLEEALVFAGLGDAAACEEGTASVARARIEDVDLEGGGLALRPGQRWRPAAEDGLYRFACEGWGRGAYTVRRSQIAGGDLVARNLHDGVLIAGGDCGDGNVLEEGGIALSGFADSDATLRGNTLDGGAIHVDHLIGTGGRYAITHNHVRAPVGEDAFRLALAGSARLEVLVGRNRAAVDGAPAALVGDGSTGVALVENHLSGFTEAGMWIGRGRAEGWDVVDNGTEVAADPDAIAVRLFAGAADVWVRSAGEVLDEGEENLVESEAADPPEAIGPICPDAPDDLAWGRVRRPDEGGGNDGSGGNGGEPGGAGPGAGDPEDPGSSGNGDAGDRPGVGDPAPPCGGCATSAVLLLAFAAWAGRRRLPGD